MIFITLGTQKFQFNRLLKAVDGIVENKIINEEIIAQTGYSDYKPKHYNSSRFFNREEFTETIQRADIIITHGGTGSIVAAIKKGKKVIAVPRLAQFGEHVDDHQLQLVKQFAEMNLIYECQDCSKLGGALVDISHMTFNSYKSNTETIIQSINEFIYGGTNK